MAHVIVCHIHQKVAFLLHLIWNVDKCVALILGDTTICCLKDFISSILDPYQLLFPLQNTFFLTTILFQREHRLTRASKKVFFRERKEFLKNTLDEECAQKCPLKRKVQSDFHLCIRFASEFPFCSIS